VTECSPIAEVCHQKWHVQNLRLILFSSSVLLLTVKSIGNAIGIFHSKFYCAVHYSCKTKFKLEFQNNLSRKHERSARILQLHQQTHWRYVPIVPCISQWLTGRPQLLTIKSPGLITSKSTPLPHQSTWCPHSRLTITTPVKPQQILCKVSAQCWHHKHGTGCLTNSQVAGINSKLHAGHSFLGCHFLENQASDRQNANWQIGYSCNGKHSHQFGFSLLN